MSRATPSAWAPAELAVLPDELLPAAPAPAPDPAQAADEARQAAEELERRLADAYGRGYEEGRASGEAAERARLRSSVEAAQALLDELHLAEERSRSLIEENICALATAVARHIIGRELRGDAAAVAELVRRAVQEFPVDMPLAIRLHPTDLTTLTTASVTEGSTVTPGRETRWIADAQVAPGGCVVEGRDRIIDGRVDLALERVYRRLTHTHA